MECTLCHGHRVSDWFDLSSASFYRSENKQRDVYTIPRCEDCGLVFVKEDVTRAELSDIYAKGYYTGRDSVGYHHYDREQTAGKFVHLAARTPYYIKRLLWEPGGLARLWRFATQSRRDRNEDLIQVVNATAAKPGKLLDVGCATGLFLAAARGHGWDVTGVEISEWAAQQARDERQLKVLAGTLEDALRDGHIAPGSFDVVTMWDVVEHLQYPTTVLDQVWEMLKDDGLLFVKTLNIDSDLAKEQGRNWHFFRPPKHLTFFSEKTLKRFLEKSGFALTLDDDFSKDIILVGAIKKRKEEDAVGAGP